MNTWNRWQIAFPLIGLSSLIFVAALFGTTASWSLESLLERTFRVAICLVMAATLVIAVSIGVRPIRDVPWLRIGLVLAGIALACGLSAIYYELP